MIKVPLSLVTINHAHSGNSSKGFAVGAWQSHFYCEKITLETWGSKDWRRTGWKQENHLGGLRTEIDLK